MYQQYLKVQQTKYGKGVFTSAQIPSNVPIMEIAGKLVLDREIPASHDLSMYLQIGPNSYLGLSGGVDDYLNHSCNPNCKVYIVGNRAILMSLYVIHKGAELTFDYSTTSTDTLDKWKMDCKCGNFKCRKVISGFQYLSLELQQKYKDQQALPLYILEPDKVQKR